MELSFLSIRRRMREIHPRGHMLVLTKNGLTPCILQNGPAVSWLDFRITLRFLFKLKSSVKRHKFANIENVPKYIPCVLKATPQEETKSILSTDSISREHGGIWGGCFKVFTVILQILIVLRLLSLNPGHSSESPGGFKKLSMCRPSP